SAPLRWLSTNALEPPRIPWVALVHDSVTASKFSSSRPRALKQWDTETARLHRPSSPRRGAGYSGTKRRLAEERTAVFVDGSRDNRAVERSIRQSEVFAVERNFQDFVFFAECFELLEGGDVRISGFGIEEQDDDRHPGDIEVAMAPRPCHQVIVAEYASAVDAWHEAFCE